MQEGRKDVSKWTPRFLAGTASNLNLHGSKQLVQLVQYYQYHRVRCSFRLMRIIVSLFAAVVLQSLQIQKVSALPKIPGPSVCKTQIYGGKGLAIRKGFAELCENGQGTRRVVDMANKKKDDKVIANVRNGGVSCDHVFELNFLSTYINNEICTLFENNKNFDTDPKRIAALEPIVNIINGKKNMRKIMRVFGNKYSEYFSLYIYDMGTFFTLSTYKQKTPNVASFISEKELFVKAGNKATNGAIVAISSYLTKTEPEVLDITTELDEAMEKLIEDLKTGLPTLEKEPAKPQFKADWGEVRFFDECTG
ncbi:hypothetical protein BT96DRAFT_974912 [Gymnopus androsaceus JB14]|uniref:Uncharacterized protein n=1 Tax=Gymnopus androsaceus JB14 TaxID=1447944 RepID=A0A6A4HT66_9AGAR|nr:hypothetical protein BT96DRAFT_974912 [Gymnopus androsaceus JB14]